MKDEAEILNECRNLASAKRCFIVQKKDIVKQTDCFLVYRNNPNQTSNKNIFVAKRSSIKNLLKFCKTL